MFKYINQILTKFSPQQRILALLLLLLSIILMTNGTDLISTIKSTPEDLLMKIETQQHQINLLQQETSKLNESIISNQRECTNKIIDREKEIASQIDMIVKIADRRIEYLKIEKDSSNNKTVQPVIIDRRIHIMVANLKNLKKDLLSK